MGEEYPGARIGPEPTTDRFNVVSYSGGPSTRDGIRIFYETDKPDKIWFSEENDAENPDFQWKIENLNPKIMFYPVFRSIRNTVSLSDPPLPTTNSGDDSSSSSAPVVIPGNALVVDERMQFRALAKFGNTFLQRFQGPNSIGLILA